MIWYITVIFRHVQETLLESICNTSLNHITAKIAVLQRDCSAMWDEKMVYMVLQCFQISTLQMVMALST